MKYRVRQMDIRSVEQGLLELWQRNLGLEGDPEQRFRWYYRDNPAGEGVSFLLEHGEEGNTTLVGSAGLNVRSFDLAGEEVSAGIMGDFNVDRQHRTLFPAFMMQRAVCGHTRANLGFGYGFPNQAAEPVLLRASCKRLALQSRYVRPLATGDHVLKVVENPLAVAGLSLGADLLLRGFDSARSAPSRLAHRLRWLTDVDGRFDALWQEARRHYPIIGHRSADNLRWRFLQKAEQFEIAAVTHRISGQLAAYAVVQREESVAHLRDLFSSDVQGLDLMLSLLVPSLRSRGCRSISFCFLGSQGIIQLLKLHGFMYREDETDKLMVVHVARQPKEVAETLLDPENWYLTELDEDE